MVGSDNSGAANQGTSVALSGDGNTALVGGMGDSNGTGAVWVWRRTDGAWLQSGSKLVGTDAVASSYQGGAVFISADGNSVIVGGIGDDAFAGAAWIFDQILSPISPGKPRIPGLVITAENTLQFVVPQLEKIKINLYSGNGKVLSKLVNDFWNAGLHTIPIPAGKQGEFRILDFWAGSYHKTLCVHP